MFPSPQAEKIQTVSELTSSLKGLLETHYSFITVSGEISSLRVPYSGHHYFILKDDKAQIKAVLFKGQARYLATKLADGQQILCKGRITIYEPRGDYQIIVEQITPLGEGNLQLAFAQRKQALTAEGLFDQQHKQQLPVPATRLCLITSPTGAAVHDFLTVALARFPHLQVEIIPVKVQGDEAPDEICQAIKLANKRAWAEVIILTRGGGSLEDLWAFNDEELTRAIFASQLPIVSAVGHEIDFTLADFVADQRAPTPTAAAEMVVHDYREAMAQLNSLRRSLAQAELNLIAVWGHRLSQLRHRLGDPRTILANYGLRLDHLVTRLSQAVLTGLTQHRHALKQQELQLRQHAPLATMARQQQQLQQYCQSLHNAMARILHERRLSLARLASKLDGLSPLAILGRGYSLTYSNEMDLIKSIKQVHPGQEIRQQLVDGMIYSVIKKIDA